MKENVSLLRDLADFFHRLNHSGFIVRHHDGDQPRVLAQCRFYIAGIDFTTSVDWNKRDLAPYLLQAFAGISNRAVLDSGSNNVVAALYQAKNAQIVGLSAAAGEHNLCRTCIEQRRYRCARLFHRRTRVLPIMVDRRRIAELLEIERAHRLKHFRQDRSGGIVVEVNAAHNSILPLNHKGH